MILLIGLSRASTPARTTSVTPAATPPATSAPAVRAAPAPAPAPAAPPAGTIHGSGTYEIGADVNPGRYISRGAAPGIVSLCIWSVKGAGGKTLDLGSAADESQEIADLGQRGAVEFETSGCADWTLRK